MNATVVYSIAWILLSFSYFKYKLIKLDIASLNEHISNLICRDNDNVDNGISTRGSVNFKTAFVNELWSKIQIILTLNRKADNERSKKFKLLTESGQLASNSIEIDQVAKKLGDLVLDYAQKEIIAVSIFFFDKTDSPYIQSIEGSISKRISESLLIIFDKLATSEVPWGLYDCKNDIFTDLTAYNVLQSYTVPLKVDDKIYGGIWFGLDDEYSKLSDNQIEFLETLASQASNSFSAAINANQIKNHVSNERDYLLGVSHDLRSPGNSAIYLIREMLLNDNLDCKYKNQLEVIESCLKEQSEMLDNILNCEKVKNGLARPCKSVYSIRDALTHVISQHQINARSKRITIISDIALDVEIIVDKQQFDRIISNLLSNAIKYSYEQSTVVIRVQLECDQLYIDVIDSGIGIPEGEEINLFKKYTRLHNEMYSNGIGIGLSTSRQLAELNNLRLSYLRNSDAGSIFRVTATDFYFTQTIPKVDYVPQRIKSKLRSILVVDDDPAVCKVIWRYVGDSAGEVHIAHDTSKAMEAYIKHSPDLIITDYNFRDVDARDFISRIKETPLVVISGDVQIEQKLKSLSLGKYEILEKPFSREDLGRVIQKLA